MSETKDPVMAIAERAASRIEDAHVSNDSDGACPFCVESIAAAIREALAEPLAALKALHDEGCARTLQGQGTSEQLDARVCLAKWGTDTLACDRLSYAHTKWRQS